MNIYESISAIMAEGYSIDKCKRNQQQGFLYRGIDDVMNTFYPLLSKYKVFVVPEVIGREREERTTDKGKTLIYSILTIRYTFYAEDGSSVSAVVVGEGMDSGDKASNKAMAVGMKYAMFQTFCIPTEEMRDADPDKECHDSSKPAPAAKKAPVAPPPGAPAYEAKQPEMFVCNKCGKKLTPYKNASGNEISIRQHAAGSETKFGQVLCLDCIHQLYPDSLKV
jgi:hypothetical protein